MPIHFLNPDDPCQGQIPQHLTPEETAELLARAKADLRQDLLQKELAEIQYLLDHPEARKSLASVLQELN